jgi:putative CocE/NonD family hydrolase
MLVRTGWWMLTTDGALALPDQRMAQELVIGAWNHGGEDDVDPFRPRWTLPDPTFGTQFSDLVAFFDRYLKEPTTSVPVKSIRYYTMNEGRWRTTPTWPPPEMGTRRWYFDADQSLSDSPVRAAGEDDYAVNPAASSGDTTRWHTNLTGGDVYYPDRAEEDADLLTSRGTPAQSRCADHGNVRGVATSYSSSTRADRALHLPRDVAPTGG